MLLSPTCTCKVPTITNKIYEPPWWVLWRSSYIQHRRTSVKTSCKPHTRPIPRHELLRSGASPRGSTRRPLGRTGLPCGRRPSTTGVARYQGSKVPELRYYLGPIIISLHQSFMRVRSLAASICEPRQISGLLQLSFRDNDVGLRCLSFAAVLLLAMAVPSSCTCTPTSTSTSAYT